MSQALPRNLPAMKNSQACCAAITPTESEVLKLLCEGNTVQQIAILRFRSRKTVETQMTSARKKLGARSFVHLGFMVASEMASQAGAES